MLDGALRLQLLPEFSWLDFGCSEVGTAGRRPATAAAGRSAKLLVYTVVHFGLW